MNYETRKKNRVYDSIDNKKKKIIIFIKYFQHPQLLSMENKVKNKNKNKEKVFKNSQPSAVYFCIRRNITNHKFE